MQAENYFCAFRIRINSRLRIVLRIVSIVAVCHNIAHCQVMPRNSYQFAHSCMSNLTRVLNNNGTVLSKQSNRIKENILLTHFAMVY